MPIWSSTNSTPSSVMATRSEEHTSELQSRQYLVCRLLLEKKHLILIIFILSFSIILFDPLSVRFDYSLGLPLSEYPRFPHVPPPYFWFYVLLPAHDRPVAY